MSSAGSRFTYHKIEVPTVVGQLRNILSQYPDNGQIIKELVQNAEDAGASAVEVVHVSEHFTLPDGEENVHKFLQGPAVCLYNDAVFSEEDWHGIRKLSESIKKDNPLQVGQFGLGFKSVFHLTDYVTIISGEEVLFMDPSEPEVRMCRCLPLQELSEVLPIASTQRALGHRLTPQHQADGIFPGTLFWFPLRQTPSEISDTIYTADHVERLFGSFGVEAGVCLTFLKSLEEITIGHMEGQKVTVTHSMKITSANMSEMRNKRQTFRHELQQCKGSPSKTLSCSYDATLHTGTGTGTPLRQDVRILHFLPGKTEAEWMKWGEKDTSKHIPLVGVAVPTSTPAGATGHVFSFLPLPPDPTNQTGLPIQVNGAFILNQNRRQVKWKTSESCKEADVVWNEDLVVKVVAKAYQELLRQLLNEAKSGNIDAPTWYSFLPHLGTLTGRWLNLGEKVWQDIVKLDFISSEMKGFLKVKDVLTCNDLDSLKPSEVANTVKEVLCSQSLPLATLPCHVVNSLSVLGQELSPVSPTHLRATLAKCTLKREWNREHLLYYASKDGKYSGLCGLPLLPLQDNTWTSFTWGASPVYLCSRREVEALQGLEERVVCVSVDSSVLKVLQAVADSGVTQVCRFQVRQHGPTLLQKSVSSMQKTQPSSQDVGRWLAAVWGILQHLNLKNIDHIPLLPPSQPPRVQDLVSLASPLVHQGGVMLSRPQVEVLGLLGVVVVAALPSYVKHIELPSHLHHSDRYGITQALNKVASKMNHTHTHSHFNGRKTEEQRQVLHSLIDTHAMQPHLKNLLRSLCIFKGQDCYNGVADLSLAAVNVIAPEIQDFPVSYPETLLTPSLPDERILALALGGVALSQSELCVRTLRSCCSDEDASRLVEYILREPQLVASSAVLQELRNTRFVPNAAGSLCRPAELYDPDDDDRDALIGETQTPDSSFRQHLPLVRSLGLRKLQNAPWMDLVSLIKRHQNTLLSEPLRLKKSAGLLRAMNRRSDCPLICKEVMAVPFVFGASRPPEYPAGLPWDTPPGLLQPQNLTSFQHSEVCGSALAVVRCHSVPSVAEACGWTMPPPVHAVVRHLVNIKMAYQQDEWTKYFSLVKKTYRELATVLGAGAAQLDNLKTDACIFTEQGFKTPAQVYIRPGSEDLRLQPYLHPLPLELRESEVLFLHLGCAPQQTPALLVAVLQAVRERHLARDASREEVERDRRLVVSVLERLQHHTDQLAGPLLVPVRTQHDTLELAEVQHSAYTDATTEWIDSDELEVSVVHQCVGAALAKALGVAPLQNFLSAGGEAVMEWGQREPLTTRLHNLLRQYRDGVSILKELVQNADDAGATTVRLLYDQRHNQDSCSMLLGKGMAQCQGPALWAYNDACFSKQDFENLREIGAGTKEMQPTKIGKFGLGFCSVYNLTDVPSFVSGSSYVVFDPHMTHLDTTTSSPGMRYDFTSRRNSYMLRTLQGQFQPFKDVFGCNIQESGSFPATLFRLPLRTQAQASTSKISDMCYSHQDMVQLLRMFSAVVGQLLLFTQHVSSITVCHLPSGAASPTQMVELFSASRGTPASVPSLCPLPTIGIQSLLERTAALFSRQQQGLKWDGSVLAERTTAEVRVRNSEEGATLCGIEEGEWGTTWLTSWHSGSATSWRLAETHQGRALPLAAVAVPVSHTDGEWRPQCLTDLPLGFYHEGHFHCFLPLPVKTFLPVQVNGMLEVASDRTNLLIQTEDDRHTLGWNATLLGDAAVRAHLGMAEALRQLGLCASVEYCATWPVVGCGGGALVESFTTSFYHTLLQEDLELFRCGRGEWHPFSHCRILEDDFLMVPEVGEAAFEFLEAYLHSSSEMRMVKLPGHMQAGLDQLVLARHTITREMFFREYFIPHLPEGLVTTDKRDLLTIHLLESGSHYMELLRPLPCIPTQPHGAPRPPCDLISPNFRIAKMFSVEDERFPLKNFLDPITRSSALSKLGMSTHSLPQELVVERAQSVASLALACPECARHRISELLDYISMQDSQKQQELAQKLKHVPFLPVMAKPEGWSVAWHKECPAGGEPQWCSSHRETTPKGRPLSLEVECPPALCLAALSPLVGSFHAVLEESSRRPPREVLEKLGVTVCPHNLPLALVVKQLCEFSADAAAAEKDNALVCHAIYEHLEDFIRLTRRQKTLNNIGEIKKLRDKKILATHHGFAEPRLFAVHGESDCAPDLFSARTEGLEKYECLMDMLGVRENFEYEVVMEVIQKKRETFADRRLRKEDVLQMSRLLNMLFRVRDSNAALEQILYLPDSHGLLYSTQDLCLDDGVELSSGQFLCLHPNISVSRDMSEWLGIKSKTRKRLSQSSNRLPFGQKEPLTTRLRNILGEYPCDSGIMKELLQNADDAGATEVTFFKDFRHLPDQRLFDPKWAPLQGPALIVFNNKGFTEQDLKSIQDLGNSSKREDPATTGQYGIGFNAVYHLTDAPSFLTKGPRVPEGETLCMFDPHCWYDPSATPDFPGVQFLNLSDLRQDHPDSFAGYLEQHFPQEGTMFRLPLRTTQNSLISSEIPKEDGVCKMLKEFERQMPHCLLFLRNVRRVSIKKVRSDGCCEEEYSVQATVPKSSDLPLMTVKSGDGRAARDPCALDVVRTSYTMTIQDTKESRSQWLVVQQLGVEDKNSLPEIVKVAFSLKTLNLLPHGGVAILLDTNADPSNGTHPNDVFSTSCYLPLPAKSGLPFSINGHFTLNSSRRDLWTGRGDVKGLWNEWLLRELLVPVAIHAIDEFKTLLFPDNSDGRTTESKYSWRVQCFHRVLPIASDMRGESWQHFVKCFYEQVRDKELCFFDSFIPDTDLPPPRPPPSLGYPQPLRRGEPQRESRKGRLVWHAFHASNDHFPVYFTPATKEDTHTRCVIPDVMRRLGMKVSSEGMYYRLTAADQKFQCPLLSPDVVLAFVKSWDQDIRDRCKPQVGSKVNSTPFLKQDNVRRVLEYVMAGEGFSDPNIDKLPLLVTNDEVLRCFTIQEPVFLSSFCRLLPDFGREFTLYSHVAVIERAREKFKSVVKTFTPADLGERLPHVLDPRQSAANARLPLPDRPWLLDLWKFVVQYVEKAYSQQEEMDWAQAKQYILVTLGKWAFYPVRERDQVFAMPIAEAWQVLDVSGNNTEFSTLPLPVPFSVGSKDHLGSSMFNFARNYIYPTREQKPEQPYIPTQLRLAATLEEPAAILHLLDFHRESVNSFFHACSKKEEDKAVINEVLEYLGKHCSEYSLPTNKIRTLQLFPHHSGKPCTLQNKKLIVLEKSLLVLDELEGICSALSLLVVHKPDSVNVTNLYKYIEPNCLQGELELYTKVILPNMRLLNEKQRMFYLVHLKKNLTCSSEREWNAAQQNVIATLRSCPFIEVDGTLRTADQFYDHNIEVFCVMGLANLPEAWRHREWYHLLKLAGLVHSVTPDMFVDFASSLSMGVETVKKSKVLCNYLSDYHENLQPKISEIVDIQFLVPQKCAKLEALLPCHQTRSGLVAFSKSVNPKFANIIWSTKSLLPSYATPVARKLQEHYSIELNVENAPAADVVKHVVKFCSSMQESPEKSPEVVGKVMESIYDHLSQHSSEVQSLKGRDIPIIHIPDHRVFVSTSRVVGSLEVEILPYLYKAPVVYGKFFAVFTKLGMPNSATPNTYACILEMIHGASRQKRLHPEEEARMKLALEGLLKDRYKLKDVSVPELYLPAQDGTLRSSCEMLVADNAKLLADVQKACREPVFVGFKHLKIEFDDGCFVKLLPKRLQPKFLSEACKVTLQQEGMQDDPTALLWEIQELLESQEFKMGVLRILHHYKLEYSSGLTKDEEKEVLALLQRVRVRQVNTIQLTLTLYDVVVGQQKKNTFVGVEGEGDQSTWTLYLSRKIPPRMIYSSIWDLCVKVLSKWDTNNMREFSDLCACYSKPHDIHKSLDEKGIKEYSGDLPVKSLFRGDVGTYLEEQFLPLLDNSFSDFHEKEIVCMRKYLCDNEGAEPENEDAEEYNIFVIVQVMKLVEKHPTCNMENIYQVNTSTGPPCLVNVRAHQLYRFVRKDDGTSRQEFENPQDIFRYIREELRRIWQVEDEQERRHLLRRLKFMWHPDKNLDRVELCTQVMQYMMSLVGRLERGEAIPEEEDPTNPPQAPPSQAYSRCFRPPPQCYRSRSRNRNRNRMHPRQPRADLLEARLWLRQARSDLEAAETVMDQMPWWTVFMCYQAAEKVLLAALFAKDREEASHKERDGPLKRILINLAWAVGNPRAVQLANTIQERTGGFLEPLYPNFRDCPKDRYSTEDARHVLLPCQELLQVLGVTIA